MTSPSPALYADQVSTDRDAVHRMLWAIKVGKADVINNCIVKRTTITTFQIEGWQKPMSAGDAISRLISVQLKRQGGRR